MYCARCTDRHSCGHFLSKCPVSLLGSSTSVQPFLFVAVDFCSKISHRDKHARGYEELNKAFPTNYASNKETTRQHIVSQCAVRHLTWRRRSTWECCLRMRSSISKRNQAHEICEHASMSHDGRDDRESMPRELTVVSCGARARAVYNEKENKH